MSTNIGLTVGNRRPQSKLCAVLNTYFHLDQTNVRLNTPSQTMGFRKSRSEETAKMASTRPPLLPISRIREPFPVESYIGSLHGIESLLNEPPQPPRTYRSPPPMPGYPNSIHSTPNPEMSTPGWPHTSRWDPSETWTIQGNTWEPPTIERTSLPVQFWRHPMPRDRPKPPGMRYMDPTLQRRKDLWWDPHTPRLPDIAGPLPVLSREARAFHKTAPEEHYAGKEEPFRYKRGPRYTAVRMSGPNEISGGPLLRKPEKLPPPLKKPSSFWRILCCGCLDED